jgi:hypothetical protein
MRGQRDGVFVNQKVYRTINGGDGNLKTFSAGLNEAFCEIIAPSGSPVNRSKFSLLPYTATQYLLLGGDGPSVTTFEIWLFDAPSATWTEIANADPQKVKRRSGHCAALVHKQGVPYVYVFGGSNGLFPARSMLVIRIEGDAFHHIRVDARDGWPCPRYAASLTPHMGKIRLFGGFSDDSTALSDLWEFNTFLFEKYPKWQLLAASGPPPRHSHQAWIGGDSLFVAGGVDAKSRPVDDVWHFSANVWQPIRVFTAINPILSCEFGLCETGNQLALVEQKQLYADLDEHFERLRQKTREYSARAVQQSEELDVLRGRLEFLKGKPSGEAPIAELAKEAEDDLSQGRKKLMGITHSLFSTFPLCASKAKFAEDATKELALQLWLKLEKIQLAVFIEDTDQQSVQRLYQEQLDILRNADCPDLPDVPLDPTDLATFERFALTLPPDSPQLQTALADYYGIQLRHYQQLVAKLGRMRRAISRTEAKTPLYEETIRAISPRLRKRFVQLQAAEAEFERWKAYMDCAEQQAQIAEEYLEYIQALGDGLISPETPAKQRPQIVRDFTAAEKEALKSAMNQAADVCAELKGASEEYAKRVVSRAIQGIRAALSGVNWGS